MSKDINFEIFYSVKTNFANEILDIINNNCEFEIISSYEWDLIKKYGHKKLVFNGPSKTEVLVREIVLSGVNFLYFNIDNDTDLEILDSVYDDLKSNLKIGVRVYLNKPDIWNRFGFDVDSEKLILIFRKYKKIINGFHFHFSTNNFNINNYELILDKINDFISRYNLKIDYIDIGGGLPGASEEIYKQSIYNKLPELLKSKIRNDMLIISEVGRNLVEDVFDLETSIVSIKKISEENFDVVIDINIRHIPCYCEKKFAIDYFPQTIKNKKTISINIFGNSCMQIDKIAENLLITSEPSVGDKIQLTKVGAYSLSQASNFISKIPEVKSQ